MFLESTDPEGSNMYRKEYTTLNLSSTTNKTKVERK